METFELRQRFLEFFSHQHHQIVPSDSLIPRGDPSLFFTTAGMVQFKPYFLGIEKPQFSRATSCQKCLRTTDIEKIGTTERHLTFFEMLGNFSFGDYFKKEAITWGWEFLTRELRLPPEKLFVTVYEEDEEARKIWLNLLPTERIIRLGKETNFWMMGETGPCGPCSEILFDRGIDKSCGQSDCRPGCNCDRYLEVWNLVFTQFDRTSDGSLKPLPRRNIDTGMGLERLLLAVNNDKDFFTSLIFQPLLQRLREISDRDYSADKRLFRIIIDHSRAITFLIAQGILPNNEGRGYVLRRLIRRAVRAGKQLGRGEPFLYLLTAEVSQQFKDVYPEVEQYREHISQVVKSEEENFLQTLDAGEGMLQIIIQKYLSKGTPIIPGDEVFHLYDTFGFPPELAAEVSAEQGLKVDLTTFTTEKEKAATRSRQAWKGSGEEIPAETYIQLKEKYGSTGFVGYEKLGVNTTVLSLLKDGKEVEELPAGSKGYLLLADTPFYGEAGGQVGDKGLILAAEEPQPVLAEVIDTQRPLPELWLHQVIVKKILKKGTPVIAHVEKENRKAISRHHTVTHLLHRALQEVFGRGATQSGSLVAPDYLRFDYSYFAAPKRNELLRVEEIVNGYILANIPVTTKEITRREAQQWGAKALFEEKYGEKVRCIWIGEKAFTEGKNEEGLPEYEMPISLELCGGTHVPATGEIGSFSIESDFSLARGIRRIVARAGFANLKYLQQQRDLLQQVSEDLRTSPGELPGRLEKMRRQSQELERTNQDLKEKLLVGGGGGEIEEKLYNLNGLPLLYREIADADMESFRRLSDRLREKLKSGLVIVVNKTENKVNYLVALTAEWLERGLKAGEIAGWLAEETKGKGGGKPDFAQGGTKNYPAWQKLANRLPEFLKSKIKFTDK